MEVCCCSTSTSLLAGGRFAASAASSARARQWGAAGGGIRGAAVLALARPPRPAAARRPARRGVTRAVFERFTERAVKAVVHSQKEARGLGEGAVAPRHLLLGLVAEDRSAGGFLSSGITVERAREECRGLIGAASQKAGGLDTDVPFDGGCRRVFDVAVELSRNMGCSFISPEHLAIALFTLDDPTTNNLLRSLGADPSQLASVAVTRLHEELAKDGRDTAGASSLKVPEKAPAGAGAGRSAFSKSLSKKKDKGALDQFCLDLTTQASGGFIDPIIGREEEIERVVQIICRRTKNNPILLGEAGVGKTAIAEGLALRIANGDVPIFLVAKRIMSLDIGLLIAGAKERGELESRITSLIREVREAGDVILFIDEVHNLVGSGTAGKGKGAGLDISNLLKPPLARGELQCIAATTLDEHRMHFEKDKALNRRFQPVFVDEPSQEDAVKILLGLRENYETYHKCKFTLEAINAAVYLSARYIPDRQLPDKAIDLIDEAGSRARIESYQKKKEGQSSVLLKEPDEYWQEIKAVQAMHDVVLSNKMKYSSNANNQQKASLNTEGPRQDKAESTTEEPIVVGTEEIARVASLWSGIPVQQLTADDKKILVGLDDELRKRVIGQDDAVAAISRAVKRSRVGLSDPDRPIATMLFCGPTGVGKTELTKALAASYFGSESAMLRLDMSEYMERHTVSKLIGSPPGYIGYGGDEDGEEGEEEEEAGGAGRPRARLTREQRELHRFRNVLRKDDFICLERVKGSLVNILAGLELHAGVFSTAEQKRIVDCVYGLQEMGKRGELGDRTYTEPEKWMRGKGRVTIQFGCCYNYATDRKGNPPGIIRTFVSDPIPELFKVMIKRLVRWRILPTDCVPDSCIVNMYDPGDCIPPHIDSHDFVRPFCTVSFLSECNILFGSSLKIAGPGEFTGSFAIPLPVGSVLVINGNGADVAKHCVPAVPSKRISITFRKMDPAKRPFSFKDDPELLNITPLEAPTAPETSRSSDEGKGKQLGIQTRDPGSRSSRSRKSKGRTTPAGKAGWGGILGDQPPLHPQSPISSVSSDKERDSIGRSREPRYPPSSDRERDSIERPREPRYPRDAPSQGEDLRDRLNRLPHERVPGSGVFFVNNGADSQARGQRMEHRQLQMINRTINDDMDSLSVGSHESSEQPRVSVRTIHNRPRTRINLGW